MGSLDPPPFFTEFTFKGQQNTSSLGFQTSLPFPLALKPSRETQPTLPESIAAIQTAISSGALFRRIQDHGGALLLRGLPISTPQEYSELAHAFGLHAHEEVGRPPHRTVLAKNVKTANEGPPEMPIWPHNEYGWSTINPAWLTFSNLHVPASGGETPLISSIGLAAALREQAPEFMDELLRKGVRYVYRYGAQAVQSNTGTSVSGAYGHTILPTDTPSIARAKIEAEVRRHSERFEWHEDGSLSVTHIVPIVRKHIPTNLPTFFGNLTSAYGRSRHHGATEPPYLGDDGSYHPLPTYGDGTVIPTRYLELALEIAEASQVLVKWEKGDVVLLDNYAVIHSRAAWTGQRTVLAALWDEEGRIGDFAEGEEILKGSPSRPIVAEG
ncbi:Clavaminate synthase-like protein [Lachnellula suecica]|uniref:Clavaminate synthase-like protein n=1 Tax=Lachnellula suecica TaxID=602035 RepID=A0A8T9CCL0_9HELO|nr:Clavaminate synthase-like protein [Lachnellula suecica]